MRKKIILCASLALFAIGAVYVLFLLSLVPANKSNHFTRKLPPHLLAEKGLVNWSTNPWRLAGDDGSAFYLAHRSLLNVVMRISKTGMDTTINTIRLAGNAKPGFNRSAWLWTDDSAFYLADGKKGELYQGSNTMWCAREKDTHIDFFDKAVVLGDNLYCRGVDPAKGFILGMRNTVTHQRTLFPDLLETQADGFFDKDGILLKDRFYSRIIYLYRYRNRFLVMDTSMRLLYAGKTIDTVSRVQLRLGKTNLGRDIKMSSPPPTVNQYACTDNGLLYVQSALQADNEPADIQNKASVVDIYDLRNGDYRYSFYISDHDQKKMKEFLISGNTLAVMYSRQLKLFELTNNSTN